MVSVASQPPVRQPSGATTDPQWGPLADDGMGNPFFYHAFQDDFDNALNTGATGLYTITQGGTSPVIHTAGDGGLALFTTGAVAGNFGEIQLPAASFTVNSQPKKVFYMLRTQLAAATTAAFVGGLVNTNTTPFSGGITDGVWFSKAAGSTQLNINTAVSGTVVTTAVTGANFANATNMDMAFYITRLGDVLVFFGSQLVGYIPQSGSGTLTPPQPGPALRLTAPSLPSANLNLTLAVSNGSTAAATTMTADFHMAHKER